MQDERRVFYSEPTNMEDGQIKKKVVLFLWLLNQAKWALRGANILNQIKDIFWRRST